MKNIRKQALINAHKMVNDLAIKYNFKSNNFECFAIYRKGHLLESELHGKYNGKFYCTNMTDEKKLPLPIKRIRQGKNNRELVTYKYEYYSDETGEELACIGGFCEEIGSYKGDEENTPTAPDLSVF